MRTPRYRIVGMLRQMFVRSAERNEALKRDKYSCCKCGVKQSKARGKEQKVEVHHKKGVYVWNDIIELITEQLLCHPDDLETLCPDCHKELSLDN